MTLLTPEKLWDIPRVGPPTALPDNRLLVPVTEHRAEHGDTTIWRVSPDSGERHPFVSGKISGIAVHPNTVAYLKEEGDHKQVFTQDLDGGEGRRAAELPLGAVGVKWLPDGRLVALATVHRDHPTLEATHDHQPDPNLTARVTENAVYRFWDTWLEYIYHPVLIDPATGQVDDLTPDGTRFWEWPSMGDPISHLDVSPDGTHICFVADDSPPPHRQLSWSLFQLDLESRKLERLDSHLEGHARRPRFTPRGIVYGYQPEPDFYASHVRLTRYDLSEGSHTPLTAEFDRSPDEWVFDSRSRLVFTAEDEGRSRLWRLDEIGGKPFPLTDDGWVTNPTIASDGTIYALGHDLSSPPEIYGLVEGSGMERITDFTLPALADVELGAVREVTVEGGHDDPIQVWIVDPPGSDPDTRRPLVHMIHGGPHGAFGDAWHWRWCPQVVAAGGYRVALVNFHGSTGWGEEFTASIHGAWGDLPFRDVEAATDHLVGLGVADEERMAVTGGSYGGYLTAWITSQTNRYAAAIAHAAVTNLGGMYASDITFGRSRSYGAEIWESRETIERWSPSAHAAGYSTPTLVIHGESDARVPATQGLELYGVLVAKGVPARLISFPDENHWVLGRANSIYWYGEFLAWLDRWLGSE